MEGFDPKASFGYETSRRDDVLETRGDEEETVTFVNAERVAADQVTLDVGRYDPVTQLLDENHVRISAGGISFGSISLRLANPAEFDLMARVSGLRLRDRTGGWRGEPFTASSWCHVSVYDHPGRDGGVK